LNCDDVANALNDALMKFKECKALYLHRIDVIIYNEEILLNFKNALKDFTSSNESVISSKKVLITTCLYILNVSTAHGYTNFTRRRFALIHLHVLNIP